MRNIKRIAIVSRDTLRAAGLRNLLASYFAPVETDLFPRVDEAAIAAAKYDFYFIDDVFIESVTGSIPERRIVVLSAPETCGCFSDRLPCLDTSSRMPRLVEAIGEIIYPYGTGFPEGQRNKALTDREIQVLRQVVSGAINKEIASRLSISFNTVLTHRKNIAAKTGIKTVSGLTFYALLNGYVLPGDIGH